MCDTYPKDEVGDIHCPGNRNIDSRYSHPHKILDGISTSTKKYKKRKEAQQAEVSPGRSAQRVKHLPVYIGQGIVRHLSLLHDFCKIDHGRFGIEFMKD